MTTIETIMQSAGNLAEAYEPDAHAGAFGTYACESGDLIAALGPVGASTQSWKIPKLQTPNTSAP